METTTIFEDVKFGGRNKVRDIVIEYEESFSTSFTLDYVQVPILIIDQ